ncbi:MAG TPA: PH domain-containing protein [Anaeromyxobacter sp.]
MRFHAPWDRTLRVTTAVVACAAAAGAALLLRLAGTTELPFATGAGVALAVAIAATLAVAWALAPAGYTVEAGRLRVDRPLRSIEIPFASIRAVAALPEGALRGSARIGGSAGLFGYYGRFWSRRLGAFRLYATRRSGLVLVDTERERFVLSPEPPERFLDVLASRAPSAARAFSGAALAPRPVPRGVKLGLAALVLLVPLAVGGIAGGVWAFSPVGARVDAGEIRIARKLAPDVVIPLADVRRVEPVPVRDGRRLRRVAGTSIRGGVRYGHFRSPELGDVQLYAWRPDGFVRVDTDERRVVLTPDDPGAFVAAVRAGAAR